MQLEEALLPYEKKLRAQERLRRFLGVRVVERPTYEQYITGPIEPFERLKNARKAIWPNNPYGVQLRARFKARTGHDGLDPLPFSDLDMEGRIAQSLFRAGFRFSEEYFHEPLPVTSPEGRVEVSDKAWMSRLIKKVGLLFGAEMVRITNVDPRWIYKDVIVTHPHVIVLVVNHIPSFLCTAPSHYAYFSAGNTYTRLKFIATQVTDFIRGLGYNADCGPNFRDSKTHVMEIMMVPTAIDAGVGEFCRNGKVLSPEFGNNMRMMQVTTDLPLDVDKPVSFGVHEFCMSCEICAELCPAKAIPYGPPSDAVPGVHNNPGYRKWYVDHERCLIFWGVNKKKWTSCAGRCLAVCPWSKPIRPLHNLVRWTAIHAPTPVRKMLVWCDKKVYHGKKKEQEKT